MGGASQELLAVQAGPYTVRGVSVAGIYTALQVPELDLLLDAGIALRSFAGTDRLLLSHTHPDHASGLFSLLGIRNLLGKKTPLTVYAPAEAVAPLGDALACLRRLHHARLDVELVGLEPGQQVPLGHDLFARAFRTHHPAPSLGYLVSRRVTKLRPEFKALGGPEIARRRREGDASIFEVQERHELAYATDTLAAVLDTSPEILDARVLIIECTYVGAWRSPDDAHAHGHLHLDELAARAERIRCEHLVLMHFSQGHAPAEVRAEVAARLPAELRARTLLFAPEHGNWFG